MIVKYVFTFVDFNFALVDYKLILVEYIFSFSRLQSHFSKKYHLIQQNIYSLQQNIVSHLVEYILTLVDYIISFSRIYTHLVDYIISFSRLCSHYSRLCIHFMRLCTHYRLDYIIAIVDSKITSLDYKISRTYIIVPLQQIIYSFYEMTVYYNKLICIRIRLYFLKMKHFVLNTSSNNTAKLRKTVTPGFCCCYNSSTVVQDE